MIFEIMIFRIMIVEIMICEITVSKITIFECCLSWFSKSVLVVFPCWVFHFPVPNFRVSIFGFSIFHFPQGLIVNKKFVVRPSIPLIDGTAETQYSSLYRMKCVQRYCNFEKTCIAKVDLAAAFTFDRDGDSTNDRMLTSKMMSMPRRTSNGKPILTSDHRCANHGTRLVD